MIKIRARIYCGILIITFKVAQNSDEDSTTLPRKKEKAVVQTQDGLRCCWVLFAGLRGRGVESRLKREEGAVRSISLL